MNEEWTSLETESWHPTIPDLGTLDSLELVRVMNALDATVAPAVEAALPQVAQAIDNIVTQLRGGGRLFYIGAGTSGRLGVLDAAECPPTFNTDPNLVQAIIAGGTRAIVRTREGAEDNRDQGGRDLEARGASPGDVVVGITASGNTPYVMGALQWARSRGIAAISVACNSDPAVAAVSDICIAINTGPEVLMGSTRLKAGTAQKMVLNMLSTGAMVRLGKTYRNLMVDMRPSNQKLTARTIRIVALATGVPTERAERLLKDSHGDTKVAIAMELFGLTALEARDKLTSSDGVLGRL